MKKYYVESSNGLGSAGIIKGFDNYAEARQYARAYAKFYGVKTNITTT